MASDYTKDEDLFDIEIAGDFTVEKDAEQIEQENSFREIPPGDHLLRIIRVEGLKKDEPIRIESFPVFVDGKQTIFDAHKLNVRFAMVDDPGAQITDMMVLPPINPKQRQAYLHGSKGVEGKGAGFWANKFTHFIQRIGWPFGAGEAIPTEACRTANWKDKVVLATIVKGEEYEDKTTRERKPGRNQIKSFSYRASSDNATAPRSTPAPQRSTSAPTPNRTQPQRSAATTKAPAGLGSL